MAVENLRGDITGREKETREQKSKRVSDWNRQRWKEKAYRENMKGVLAGAIVALSPEVRAVMSAHRRDKKFSIETREAMSTAKGGLRLKIITLALRGMRQTDMAKVLRVSKSAIGSILHGLRYGPAEPVLSHSEEDEARAKREAMRLRHKLAKLPEYAQHRERSLVFVGRIMDEGFITKDLTDFEQLQVLYEEKRRALPGDPSDQIRLEIFLKAIKQATNIDRPDKALLLLYLHTGEAVDSEWFLHDSRMNAEQFFINSQVSAKRRNGSGM